MNHRWDSWMSLLLRFVTDKCIYNETGEIDIIFALIMFIQSCCLKKSSCKSTPLWVLMWDSVGEQFQFGGGLHQVSNGFWNLCTMNPHSYLSGSGWWESHSSPFALVPQCSRCWQWCQRCKRWGWGSRVGRYSWPGYCSSHTFCPLVSWSHFGLPLWWGTRHWWGRLKSSRWPACHSGPSWSNLGTEKVNGTVMAKEE